MIGGFFEESIVKRAQEKKLVEIEVVNLRDFAKDKYKTIDDKPYGGGVGMVMMVKPIVDAISSVSSQGRKQRTERSYLNKIPRCFASRNDRDGKSKVILTSPRGVVYTQKKAQEYAKLGHLILIAGHYEGVDERVVDYIDEEVSIGDFIMTGGEITAAAVVDSVVRLIPAVLKKQQATAQESFFEVSIDEIINAVRDNKQLGNLKNSGIVKVRLLEFPQYTRPEKFEGKHVPEVLLSGNHAAIREWQLKKAFEETIKRRPDLLESA